jgi:hypothetical protein
MPERFRCAVASRDHAEAVSGTASTVRRWLVVEQPGPWGRDAVVDSGLPDEVATVLRSRARAAGARTLLMRRGRGGAGRRAYTAFSGPGEAWLEVHEKDGPDGLLDIDLAGLGAGVGTGGERLDRPIALTCTNGSHDACCAEFGRPVAAALETLLEDRAWEVSHIGGDRFAPNVLVLPHGLYHGRVTLAHVSELARAVDDGRVWLPGYRGRSIHPFGVQAAEIALRAAGRRDRVDGVEVTGWRERDGVLEVRMTADGEGWEADVTTVPHPDAWRLTCQSPDARHPPVHHVTRLDRVAATTP